jgi:hypothetical protein
MTLSVYYIGVLGRGLESEEKKKARFQLSRTWLRRRVMKSHKKMVFFQYIYRNLCGEIFRKS